jgi:hypothetical protein
MTMHVSKATTTRAGAVASVLVLTLALAACRYTGFTDTAGKNTASAATQWLVKQQQTNGGFELAGAVNFETSDAILAIAENAQQQAAWNTTQAHDAVAAIKKNGHSPLHYIDDLVDGALGGPINAGTAAKEIVMVAKPLGYSLTNFNPDGDAKTANLVSIMNAGAASDGSFGLFGETLYAAMAKRIVDGAVPAKTVAFIKAAQHATGAWDFTGLPTGDDLDIDTTALAVVALAAANVPATDTNLRAGLHYLATHQRSDGAWQAFGSDDPNSTSTAIYAITAAGFDAAKPCWRNVVAPGLAGNPYTSPTVWLESQQNTGTPTAADRGRINSQNDGFGVNTFATTQSIEALRRAWMPPNPVAQQNCP